MKLRSLTVLALLLAGCFPARAQILETWTPSNLTVKQDAMGSPDGTANAQMLIESTNTNYHYVEKSYIKPAVATTYELSAYLHSLGRNVYLQVDDGTTGIVQEFNASTGAAELLTPFGTGSGFSLVSTSSSASAYGYYRVKMTFTSTALPTLRTLIGLFNTGPHAYAGDGASGVGIYDVELRVAPIPALAAETPYPAPTGTFTQVSYKGVNIVGGESQYPTTNKYNYIYPGDNEIDYFASKGFGMIRMSVTARRLQPTSYGMLDPANRTDEPANGYVTYPAGSQTNLLEIKRVLDHALSKNMYVMLEPHDYGYIYDSATKTRRLIGRDGEATAQFVDFWTRVKTKFQNYPNLVINIMNEPHDQTAAEWKTGATAAINGIAAVSTSQLIAVPGTYWTSAYHWATDSGNSTAWAGYVPPAGQQIAFDMHNYLDSGQSGTQLPCQVGVGSSSLTNATTWARTNNFKIILGEFGWSTDPTCPPEATTFMSYMTSNPDVFMGWTYFNGGSHVFYGNYAYGVAPTGYPSGPFTDKPQMSILVANH